MCHMKKRQYRTARTRSSARTQGAYFFHASNRLRRFALHRKRFDSETRRLEILETSASEASTASGVQRRNPQARLREHTRPLLTLKFLSSVKDLFQILAHDVLDVSKALGQSAGILQGKLHVREKEFSCIIN
jgi:magnesium-transporting ATPase (P-type)